MVEKLFSVAEKNTCRFLFIVTSCWWLFLDQLGLKQFGGGFFCPDSMASVDPSNIPQNWGETIEQINDGGLLFTT
ncbi:hypothetical protein T03_17793 [Trichinella britovi]|uniref:Uncharacterized protein n=1 Tax=Trichinella britovi TaxID=45882 RepID=A0A0V1CMR7_TRIBR|nr:hypothetical protein T03_17793 [Trichinella britovi]